MQPDTKHLLRLLVKVYNRSITDFFYFPDVIFVGNQKIERADFERLLSEKLITPTRYDSFGRYYVLSKKGAMAVREQSAAKSQRKKPVPVSLNQGCLYFNRLKNGQASGARCLLFF